MVVLPGTSATPLQGKVALVTGGGRGIGKGYAVELARRGASVVINYNSSAAAADKTVQEIKSLGGMALALKANVTSIAEVSKMFEDAVKQFGRMDIIVSNSGSEIFMPEEEVTEEDYDRIFALNTKAQFFVAQQGYKHLPKNGGGRIILTSSVAATMSGVPNHALYAGSKAAIGGFVRSFAKDYGNSGVTVNAIAPGGVKTDMYTDNSWHYVPGGYKGMPIDIIDKGLADFCPLGRVGLVEDIAKVVAFLASPESEWINAQVLTLSGGSST